MPADADPVVIRVAVMEEWRTHVDRRFDGLDSKIEGLSAKIDGINKTFPWASAGTGIGALIMSIVGAVKLL